MNLKRPEAVFPVFANPDGNQSKELKRAITFFVI
jgi:hypothetical protein